MLLFSLFPHILQINQENICQPNFLLCYFFSFMFTLTKKTSAGRPLF